MTKIGYITTILVLITIGVVSYGFLTLNEEIVLRGMGIAGFTVFIFIFLAITDEFTGFND